MNFEQIARDLESQIPGSPQDFTDQFLIAGLVCAVTGTLPSPFLAMAKELTGKTVDHPYLENQLDRIVFELLENLYFEITLDGSGASGQTLIHLQKVVFTIESLISQHPDSESEEIQLHSSLVNFMTAIENHARYLLLPETETDRVQTWKSQLPPLKRFTLTPSVFTLTSIEEQDQVSQLMAMAQELDSETAGKEAAPEIIAVDFAGHLQPSRSLAADTGEDVSRLWTLKMEPDTDPISGLTLFTNGQGFWSVELPDHCQALTVSLDQQRFQRRSATLWELETESLTSPRSLTVYSSRPRCEKQVFSLGRPEETSGR